MAESRLITIAEIRYWSLWRGVACVVLREEGGWVTTACGSWRTGGSFFAKKQPRVCRKCRLALRDLRRTSEVGDA